MAIAPVAEAKSDLSEECLTWSLPPAIEVLRRQALEAQRQPCPGIPEITLADARAWAQHDDGEDWLLWRGRRCAERLRSLPVAIDAGELLVGKPRFHAPERDQATALEQARQTLGEAPPFPGGDAGHFHPDYDKVFRLGLGGLMAEVRRCENDCDSDEKRVFYQACATALEGLVAFFLRVGDQCAALSPELSAICHRLAEHAPQTFHEALQLMFLLEVALWFGEDHTLTAPGRIDRTLRHFYDADVASGRLTPRRAFELLCCLYIQMNRLLWPGSAVSVMVGGRDAEGRDVTHDLSYLALAARLATRLVYPTVGVAWHEGTPDEFMDFCVQVLSRGVGCPAFFGEDVIAAGLRERGVSERDCRNFMNSTCVEIKVTGCSNIWVTQPYFNCPQALLEVMQEAVEGDVRPPATFEEFSARVRRRLADRIAAAARRLDEVWRARGERGCFPLASCFIADCLERGLDFDRGGARYNWVENSFVGLANLVDSLVAVREFVYERGELSLAEFWQVLSDDFAGHERLRQRILRRLPKYGNADPEVDALAARWAQFLIDETESHTVGLDRYAAGFFCWVQHERLGAQTGATPDGRTAGWPLADGAGAAQGRETHGPTASVLSTTTWSHQRVLGGLVHNARFADSLLHDARGRRALRDVIETYLRRGGFEIQINVVGAETLRAAQNDPEQYPDLLVRVAGYSDYFVHLNRNMQEEIIARTMHQL